MTDSTTNPRHAAKVLSGYGRNGDTVLVHVSKDELRGLDALAPGRMTTNPQTGLPEAFGLGDILGIIGGIAGAAAAPWTGGMSLALTGALGGGLGTFAGNLIEGKDIGTSLGKGMLSGLLGYGVGSATSSLASAGASAASAGAEGLVANGVTPAALTPEAASAAIGGAASPAAGGYANVGDLMAGQGIGGVAPAAQVAGPAAQGAGQYGSVGDLIAGERIMPNVDSLPFTDRAEYAMQGASDPQALWDTFGKKAMSTTVPIGLGLYGQSISDQPTGMTQPPQGMSYPTLPGPNQRKYKPLPPGYDLSQGREWNYWTPAYADGGQVGRKKAAQQKTTAPRPTMEQQLDRFGKQLDDMAPVYRGYESPNPFMRDAANEQRFARGGLTRGPGNGMDDAIPAIIDGRKPAKLSSGEFVVPAHAVSALGNGSTEAGAAQLDNMVNNVMMAKYGTADRTPRPVNPKAVMPGGQGASPFAEGGLARFDPESDGYDDESALRMGIRPDSTGHRPTYGDDGLMLKGARHPTRYKSITEDERLGYESYKADDGRYYVRQMGGYGYKDGGSVNRPALPMVDTAMRGAEWLLGDRQQDPMRSWNMDPLPSEFPTTEDAQAQRIYNIRYGDQRDNITNETRMSRVDGTDWGEDKRGENIAYLLNKGHIFKNPSPQKPIGWDVADQMMAAKMASDTSAVASLGFDPSVTSYSTNAGLSANGVADIYDTKRMWVDTTSPTAPTHEAIHRGHQIVAESGPEGLAAIKALRDKWGNGEEHSTRAEMLRRYGSVEKKTGGGDHPQITRAEKLLTYDDFRKQMRDVDRVAHKLNAQRVIDKAGGVYARGGVIRRRG